MRAHLGSEWVRLERLTDGHQCLSLKEQRQLEVVLDDFERAFPQCFFAVFLGPLPAAITPRSLGFWLINHGAFQTQQISKRNDFGLALVIDIQHHSAAFTLGYALEHHLTDADTMHILQQICKALGRRRYAVAIEQAVRLVSQKLAQAGTKGLPEAPASIGTHDLAQMGLQPLRAFHKPPAASNLS
jgi:uncharacterized membrane protein YgcG